MGAGASRRGGDAPTAVAQAEAAPPPPAPPPPRADASRTTGRRGSCGPSSRGHDGRDRDDDAAPAPDFKKINVGVAMRVGAAFHSATDSSEISDTSLDEIYVEPRFSGDIAPMFAWQANFQGGIPSRPAACARASRKQRIRASQGVSASVLDLIAKFEPAAAFHLWAGRMLVPVRPVELQRPVVHEPLEVPGPLPGRCPYPVGPKQGPQGRNNGATVWGEFLGAKLKYYAGVFDLNDADGQPAVLGAREHLPPRVGVGLLSQQHLLRFAGHRRDRPRRPVPEERGASTRRPWRVGNLTTVIADVLAEKNLGAGGVITGEAPVLPLRRRTTSSGASTRTTCSAAG